MTTPTPPLISVIIPTYNYAAVITRAIESVLNQAEAAEVEVWVIDDGSTDDSAERIAHCQSRWPTQLHYHRQANQGPATARNQGVRLSQGAYLLFLDADDELLPDALALFKQSIQRSADTVVWLAGHVAQEADGRRKLHRVDHSANDDCATRLRRYLIDKDLPVCQGAVLLRRDFFQNYRYPEQFRAAEDIPVFVHALANYPCGVLSQPSVCIHKHDDSLRNASAAAQAVGLTLIDEIFDAQRLPAWALTLRSSYTARRCRSLFRTLARSDDDPRAAWAYYRQALRLEPWSALAPRYLSKALRTVWRLRRTPS